MPLIYTLFMLPGEEKSAKTGWCLLAGWPGSGHVYYQTPDPPWADFPSRGGSTTEVSVLLQEDNLGMKFIYLVTTYIFENSDKFN